MITRTWNCLNRNCLHTFNFVDRDHPPCPRCGCLKVKWVPGRVNIKSAKTQNIDQTVRELVASHGDQNYRSPARYESMAPRYNPTPVKGKTRRLEVQPGWAIDAPLDAGGNVMSYCGPTGVTAKIAPAIGGKSPAATVNNRRMGVGGRIEKAYRP